MKQIKQQKPFKKHSWFQLALDFLLPAKLHSHAIAWFVQFDRSDCQTDKLLISMWLALPATLLALSVLRKFSSLCFAWKVFHPLVYMYSFAVLHEWLKYASVYILHVNTYLRRWCNRIAINYKFSVSSLEINEFVKSVCSFKLTDFYLMYYYTNKIKNISFVCLSVSL